MNAQKAFLTSIARAWVPAAIIWFGLSDATVYFVILMGAVPSIILVVSIAIELLVFAPVERRVLRSRGLVAETS